MRNDELKTLIARLLREASGPRGEHERLRRRLDVWAKERGYAKVYKALPGGGEPDVLRVDEADNLLFVGDAKDAENETSDRQDTLLRIQGYLNEFADLLSTFRGGIIAIATNEEDAAQDWASTLNLSARFAGIVGPKGARPSFKVEKVDGGTWIAWW